jgi:hypothetical protein
MSPEIIIPCPNCGKQPEEMPAAFKKIYVFICPTRIEKIRKYDGKPYKLACRMGDGTTRETALIKWNKV